MSEKREGVDTVAPSEQLTLESLATTVSSIDSRLTRLEEEVHNDYKRRTVCKELAERLRKTR